MDANGGWDATETTWKNPCTTDRMNQWTNETWIKMIELVNRGINESQKRFSESMHQPKNRWISEPLNESRWTSESVNQWNVKNSMNQWTSDRTNKWIDEWMDGWVDGWATYFFVALTYFFTQRRPYLLSQLLLLWAASYLGFFSDPASQLATRIIWNQLTMHLATSSCSPACQERRSITERFAPRSLANRSCHSQLQIRI